MSMRVLMSVGIMATLVGNGSAAPKGNGGVAGISSSKEEESNICVDYPNCTMSNGTGIYFAEGGDAGIGSHRLLITHFKNTHGESGEHVMFQGRYFEGPIKQWRTILEPGGLVVGANYLGKKGLRVLSVSERSTVPTWTLLDAGDKIPVTGDQLLGLQLIISIPRVGRYVLDFAPIIPVRGKQSISAFNMRWREGESGVPTQYCVAAENRLDRRPSDQVVFQQGIVVDPLNGSVSRLNTTDVVTISCRLGAPATVYSWGYPYQGTDSETFYFDAGIHMKRASYCADSFYYTYAGTKIAINDNIKINSQRIDRVEALWTPKGASCLTHKRHPTMPLPNKSFSGMCKPGIALMPCTDLIPAKYLMSGMEFVPR